MSCNKIPYVDKADALKGIKHILNNRRHFKNPRFKALGFKSDPKVNKKLYPYECRQCGKWHLTTQKQKKFK